MRKLTDLAGRSFQNTLDGPRNMLDQTRGAAIRMLGHVLDTSPDQRAPANLSPIDSLLNQARHMQDEMAQIALVQLGVGPLDGPGSRSAALIAASDYCVARAMMA